MKIPPAPKASFEGELNNGLSVFFAIRRELLYIVMAIEFARQINEWHVPCSRPLRYNLSASSTTFIPTFLNVFHTPDLTLLLSCRYSVCIVSTSMRSTVLPLCAVDTKPDSDFKLFWIQGGNLDICLFFPLTKEA